MIEASRVTWPDRCIGVHSPSYACLHAETPGYRIIVERNGKRIEYHTDLNMRFRRAPERTSPAK